MHFVRIAIAIALLVIGGLLLAPLARAWVFQEHATGRVLDLLPMPMENGLVRATVAYQFLVETPDAIHRHLSYAQADGLFRPVEDPLLDADELEGARRSLGLTAGGPDLRSVTVFYRAEDPGASAAIHSVSPNDRTRRYALGLGVIVAALVVLWFARQARNLDSGTWTRSMRRTA